MRNWPSGRWVTTASTLSGGTSQSLRQSQRRGNTSLRSGSPRRLPIELDRAPLRRRGAERATDVAMNLHDRSTPRRRSGAHDRDVINIKVELEGVRRRVVTDVPLGEARIVRD